MGSFDRRLGTIERVLQDLPPVHTSGVMTHAPEGAWHSERSAYEFLARCCHDEARTLETGCGVSTVLFATWGTHHTCVTPAVDEVERVKAYCQTRDISLDHVTFQVGPSDEVLPSLSSEGPLDVLFIDGGHGFPAPIMDWYYAGSRLRAGGVVLIDDIQLASVSVCLIRFLNRDPRWQGLARTTRWAAYHRLSEGVLREDWGLQVGLGIFPTPGSGSRSADGAIKGVPRRLVKTVAGLARRTRGAS